MKHIIPILCGAILCLILCTVFYKVGAVKGYNLGYDEGYRYDCKEEIANLYGQVKAQKKLTDIALDSFRTLKHENDSLRSPATYVKRYRDSVEQYRQFAQDSALYYRKARKHNAEFVQKYFDIDTSMTNMRIVGDDGKLHGTFKLQCLLRGDFKDLPECQPGWRIK